MAFSNYSKATGAQEVAIAFHERIEDKTILITGANPAGLGYAFAKAVAEQNPKLLIFTYRSQDKADEVKVAMRKDFPNMENKLLFVHLDLANLASVRAAAAFVNEKIDHLDILLNNAAVMSVQERTLTADGFELQWATNHLGHFLFTNLIMDKIVAAAKRNPAGSTRVVNMSGGWHQFSPVRFSDINFSGGELPMEERPDKEYLAKFGHGTENVYIPEVAYAQSKSANIMFSVYLTEHLKKHNILSFGINPGGVLTEIARYLPKAVVDHLVAMGIADKTPDTGAAPGMRAAFDPTFTATTPPYIDEDCQAKPSKSWTTDRVLVERLWHVSEEMVGQKFDLAAF